MKPLCREIPNRSSGSFVAFMPYLHWESEGKRQEMNTAIADIISSKRYDMAGLSRVIEETVKKTYNNRSKPSANPNKSLFAEHLFPEPPQPPLHLRRTLDQFQYYMTDNTEDRDTDQVISRYFKRRHSDTPLPIMMVDQLWIWILDRKTVVTSFPQRWDIKKGQPRDNNILDTGNILDSILNRLKQKERSSVMSVFDLAELIMARCLGLNSDKKEWEYERYRYLEIFDYSINYVKFVASTRSPTGQGKMRREDPEPGRRSARVGPST